MNYAAGIYTVENEIEVQEFCFSNQGLRQRRIETQNLVNKITIDDCIEGGLNMQTLVSISSYCPLSKSNSDFPES